MEPILVVFIIFGSVGLILWKYIDTRHKERMGMIDKGMSTAELRGNPVPFFRPNALTNLKWGLLALFVGVGILTASYIEEQYGYEESVYPALMLIFGGVALIAFYTVAARKEKREG
jgi:hypothetical protein